MAYEKQTWQCGEVVTADKLNHMEDGIENATGFSCTEETTLLTDESVTPETHEGELYAAGVLAYTTLITADKVRVTFNGTEYECERRMIEDGSAYGAYLDIQTGTIDWSQYPFVIESSPIMGNALVTESAGTYQIKIETFAELVETTECFRKAVNEIVDNVSIIVINKDLLSPPSAGGLTKADVDYRDCDSDTSEHLDVLLWDGVNAYNGQPIIVNSLGDGASLAHAIVERTACASTFYASSTGDKIGLLEETKFITVQSDFADLNLFPTDAKFYRGGIK